MPEIAEVETVRKRLKKEVLNKKIKDIRIIYNKTIINDIDSFKNSLINEEFIDIKRTGKYLLFETKNKYLISHLRMEGRYYLKNSNLPVLKHEHVIFDFSDGSSMRYVDTRKFGRMELINKEELINHPTISKLGIEPNDPLLTKEYLYNKINKKNISIKTLLLDQTIILGLGNIYANEVLFKSGIDPTRLGSSITLDECKSIIDSTNIIIKEAIKDGGTTIHSFESGLGITGNYQDKLLVHGHEKSPCPNCQTSIIKIKVNGRGTYYCPNCQK